MGTWGPGNFEDDEARDFLADMIGHWERLIDRSLAGEATEEGAVFRFSPGWQSINGCVLPTVEVMIAVAHQLPCDSMPSPAKISAWLGEVLGACDAEIDALLHFPNPDNPPEFKAERRRVIVETFDRLSRLAEAPHDGELAGD